MNKEFKKLSNQITLLRFIAIPILWVLAFLQQSKAFAILLLITGLTDILDGVVARIRKEESKFGASLDSLADNIIGASIPFWLYLLMPEFFMKHLVYFLIPFVLFLISLTYGYLKYKKQISYHLYTMKLSGIFFYSFLIHGAYFSPNIYLFYATIIGFTIACLEEIIITLTNKKMKQNKKSLFL